MIFAYFNKPGFLETRNFRRKIYILFQQLIFLLFKNYLQKSPFFNFLIATILTIIITISISCFKLLICITRKIFEFMTFRVESKVKIIQLTKLRIT